MRQTSADPLSQSAFQRINLGIDPSSQAVLDVLRAAFAEDGNQVTERLVEALADAVYTDWLNEEHHAAFLAELKAHGWRAEGSDNFIRVDTEAELATWFEREGVSIDTHTYVKRLWVAELDDEAEARLDALTIALAGVRLTPVPGQRYYGDDLPVCKWQEVADTNSGGHEGVGQREEAQVVAAEQDDIPPLAAAAASLVAERRRIERFVDMLRREQGYGEPARPGRYRLLRGRDRNRRPALTWTVGETLPEYGVGQFIGQSYSGKTYVAAIHLALSLCNDKVGEWFGRSINRHGNVVVVLMEGAWDYPNRVQAWLAGHPGCTDERLITVEEEPINIAIPDDVKALRDEIAHLKPVAVFIDTQSLATPGVAENDNTDMNQVFANLKALAKDLNCVVSTVHHTGHTETGRARGASAQFAASDFSVTVRSASVQADKVKGFRPWERPVRFKFKEVQLPNGDRASYVAAEIGATALLAAADDFARDRLKEQILEALASRPLTSNQLAAACNMREAEVREARNELHTDGFIRSEDGPNNSKIWSLNEPD